MNKEAIIEILEFIAKQIEECKDLNELEKFCIISDMKFAIDTAKYGE